MDNFSKNIISTVTYYDVLDYPLTSFEIWKYLIQDAGGNEEENKKSLSLNEVVERLENEMVKDKVKEFRGFYFLKNREKLVEQRIERNKISNRKIKKSRKIIFWLRFVPFIKMVALAGRVGAKNAQSASDIDVLIVFKHGKIFTGRFLSTMLVHLMGQRRYGNKVKDRICLNHFLSDKFNVSIQDLYSSHSYIFATPLYGGKHFNEFLQKNQWIKKYRPNFYFLENNAKELSDSLVSNWTRKILEAIFSPSWVETKLKNLQIEKIKKNPLTQKSGGVIIYNDFELTFWPDFENQGPKIFEKFKTTAQ